MATLLHQLLYDVRQRCNFLANTLDGLKPTLAKEALPYREQMAQRVARIQAHVESMLIDPALQDPNLARNYYYDYKRIAELSQDIEAFPVLALSRFGEEDRIMTTILDRLCKEVGYPYRSPLCSTISSTYYWAVSSMDLVFVPCSEPFHLLALSDLYHELAHFIMAREEKRIVPTLKNEIDRQFDILRDEAKQRGVPSGTLSQIENARRQWKRNWYLELSCDMIAAFWVGPAFGWSNVRLCANASAGLFDGMDSHPADESRASGISLMLRKIGCAKEADDIDSYWTELVGLSGELRPQEFELVYPPKLLNTLVEEIMKTAQDLGLVCWKDQVDDGSIRVTTLLNQAWNSFRNAPATFAEYETEQIARLRGSAN